MASSALVGLQCAVVSAQLLSRWTGLASTLTQDTGHPAVHCSGRVPLKVLVDEGTCKGDIT